MLKVIVDFLGLLLITAYFWVVTLTDLAVTSVWTVIGIICWSITSVIAGHWVAPIIFAIIWYTIFPITVIHTFCYLEERRHRNFAL